MRKMLISLWGLHGSYGCYLNSFPRAHLWIKGQTDTTNGSAFRKCDRNTNANVPDNKVETSSKDISLYYKNNIAYFIT